MAVLLPLSDPALLTSYGFAAQSAGRDTLVHPAWIVRAPCTDTSLEAVWMSRELAKTAFLQCSARAIPRLQQRSQVLFFLLPSSFNSLVTHTNIHVTASVPRISAPVRFGKHHRLICIHLQQAWMSNHKQRKIKLILSQPTLGLL
ncbi:hypothetical protein ASPVEDRAFT_24886 [Aspergillus versicolor CBS 583.65]|uniref:Uncharacterized protein n=1 Tax=Aspergillus versicolor CBS 583.65 TaxID=1036611 RepID=A0A1L9P921_ASPVE|nr:uncharacterized protein ASPVEDRAFT_24886 [Aspergillus versicolor CBS 583.65]OJI97973.1 hypothetical protein ASPVEDRAFT_24886 [Aspergillus versicolor CBS 583.65]